MTGPLQTRLAAAHLYLIAPGPGAGAIRTWQELLAGAAAGGVEAVQLRWKQATTDERRAALREARSALPVGVLLLANDDLEAAFDPSGRPLADGVHLGREDAEALARGETRLARRAAGLRAARARLGTGMLLGTSTRSLAEVAAAVEAGVDYVGFGALAETRSKSDSQPADPRELARSVAAYPALPIFAIGGLDERRLDLVLAAGCRRAAVGAAILDARDPRAAALALRRRLES